MKKLLLTTTAVAGLVAFTATGASAAGIDLNLGGNFKAYAGVTDQDTANLAEQDLKRSAEINFNGETTLDNGLTVGVNVEMQAEPDGNAASVSQNATTTQATDIEESYIYFSGNWGRVNIGAEDGAAYLLQVAAPSADSNIDGLDPEFLFVNTRIDGDASASFVDDASDFVGITRYASDISGDADKITYMTPKVNGFQAGVSYAPDLDQEVATENLAGAETDNEAGHFENFYSVAARYDGEVDGIGIHLGAGYETADAETSGEVEDWNVGAKVAYDAFSVGVAYNEKEADASFGPVNWVADTEAFIVGADYTSGAYKVGASYFESEEKNTNDELTRYSIGGGYTYGPGMSFRGSVNFYEMDNTGGVDNDATSILVGTDISF